MKRPFLYILIPFCFGIAISHLLKLPLATLLLTFIFFAIAAVVASKNNRISSLSLYLAIFFLGMAFYCHSLILPSSHIANLTTDEPVRILLRGTVADDPIVSDTPYGTKKIRFTLNSNFAKVDDKWKIVTGLVSVSISSKNDRRYQYGDELLLDGMLSKPHSLRNPGLFNYANYLAIKEIYSYIRVKDSRLVKIIGHGRTNWLMASSYKIRDRLNDILDKRFKMPYGGFLKSIITGERMGLGEEIEDDFIKTGTVHVIAISGLQVGLIAGIVLAIFGLLRIPKRINLVLTLIMLLFYSLMTGANPPIMRAVIMFFIFVAGYLINRDADILNSLSLAALIILLWNPKELFDPSFQLSFISIAGTILLCPVIDTFLGIPDAFKMPVGSKVRLYFLKSISVSIAAWLASWPLVAAYFNIVSPVSVVANLIVIPALFALSAASFLFFAANFLSPFLGGMVSGIVSRIEQILFAINHVLAQLPLAYFRMKAPGKIFLVIYYFFLLWLFIFPDPLLFKRLKIYKKHAVIIFLVALNIFAYSEIYSIFRKNLAITFLDVGQGDSAFIELPGRGNILIDGGSGGEDEKFDIGKSVVAPYLWNRGVRVIDAVIATHFHEDHIGGIIYVLENFKVGCVIDNGALSVGNKIHDRYMRLIKEKRIRHLTVGEGDTIEIFRGIKLSVLNPPKGEGLADSNEDSLSIKLTYKNFSCLFCGDMKSNSLDRLLSYGKFLESDVIKIPHHGGSPGNKISSRKFFERVSPKISIISVGMVNSYNMPSPEVLNIITSLNSICYSTKDYGAIQIFADSNGYEILPYKRINN